MGLPQNSVLNSSFFKGAITPQKTELSKFDFYESTLIISGIFPAMSTLPS